MYRKKKILNYNDFGYFFDLKLITIIKYNVSVVYFCIGFYESVVFNYMNKLKKKKHTHPPVRNFKGPKGKNRRKKEIFPP